MIVSIINTKESTEWNDRFDYYDTFSQKTYEDSFAQRIYGKTHQKKSIYIRGLCSPVHGCDRVHREKAGE